MMLEAALWIAMGCALCGALTGNRTAWALLASVGLCLALDAGGVEFHFFFWLLIDFALVALIVRSGMTYADCIVLALFLPAWGSYLLPDPERYYGSVTVACLQLLLTFPAGEAWRRVKRLRNVQGVGDDFDLKTIHAGAY